MNLQVSVSEVSVEYSRMLADEGFAHVEGRYIPNPYDAEWTRKHAAERRVRDRKRAEFHAVHCAWCEDRIEAGQITVAVNGNRKIHQDICLPAFVEWADPEGGSLVSTATECEACGVPLGLGIGLVRAALPPKEKFCLSCAQFDDSDAPTLEPRVYYGSEIPDRA